MRGWHFAATLMLVAINLASSVAHSQESSSYPAQVCPLVGQNSPQIYCAEATSLRWEAPSEEAPYKSHYPSLEFYQYRLLEKAKAQGCSDCKIIMREDVQAAQAHNSSLGWDKLPYSAVGNNVALGGESQYSRSSSEGTQYSAIVGKIVPLDFSAGNDYQGDPQPAGAQKLLMLTIDSEPLNFFAIYTVSAAATCPRNSKPEVIYYGPQSFPAFYCSANLTDTALDGLSGLDADKQGCAYGCNPVNMATGTKVDYAVDYRNYSPFPIAWDRSYRSISGQWTFGYLRSLQHFATGGGNRAVHLLRPDGTTIAFTQVGGVGPWVATKPQALGQLSAIPTASSPSDPTFSYVNLEDQTEIYSGAGRLLELRDRHGRKLVFSYSASTGELIFIEDDFGRYLEISYAGMNGRRTVAAITDGDRTISYEHGWGAPALYNNWSAPALLTKVTHADGTSVEYAYDENLASKRGLLTGITKEDGQRWATYGYDVTGRVASTEHGEGLDKVNYAFAPGSQATVSWSTGSASFPLGYSAQAFSKTAGSTSPCPSCGGLAAQAINYNNQGVPTAVTDFQNVQTQREVNERGLPTSETVGVGTAQAKTTTYTWHPTWRIPQTVTEEVDTTTGATTRTVSYTYNAQALPTEVSVETAGLPSRVSSSTYNAQGLVLTETNARGFTTNYTYDGQGNLLRVTNALGHVLRISSYTPQGLPERTIDANGLHTIYVYDQRDRITAVKRGSPTAHWEITKIAYYPEGMVKRVDQPNGQWTIYSYDSANRLTQVRDARGKMVLTLSNDGDVLREQVFDAAGTLIQTRRTVYDAERRVAATLDAQSRRTNFSYDQLTRQLSRMSDPDGTAPHQGVQQYDDLGRPSRSTSPGGELVVTSYNRAGQVTNVRDALTANTGYGYNGFGERIWLRSADAGISTMGFDEGGNLSTRTDARGVTLTMLYDGLDRPLSKHYNGSTSTPVTASETQTFAYDSCTGGVGRTCEVTDHSGTTRYQYDLWGRVTSKQFEPAGSAVLLSISYTYDATGQLIATTYPSGNALSRTLESGRTASLTYAGRPLLHAATYRPLGGGLEGFSWSGFAGGMDLTYDLNGLISGITDTDQRSYVRNAKGWLTGVADSLDPSADQLYRYDLDGHLVEADLAVRPDAITYQMKGNSNITQVKVGPQAFDTTDFAYTAPAANKLTQVIQDGVIKAIRYDRAGNMIDDGAGLKLTYDAKNRPRSANWFGSATGFAFNAMGQRMRKAHAGLPGGAELYMYDETGMLIGRYSATGQALEEFVYLEGRPVAALRDFSDPIELEVYPVLTDHLGTPRKVLDSSGQTVWSWDSKDPYGNQRPNEYLSGSPIPFTFYLRFPGQWFDDQTGLFHNGFRDYSPKLGRYIQPDPIGLDGGMNSYAYVGANPLNGVDPLGLMKVIVAVWDAGQGHVMMTDAKGKVMTNQYPNTTKDKPLKAPNITPDVAMTLATRSDKPRIYEVDLDSDKDIQVIATAAMERGAPTWIAVQMFPWQTNCVVAATNVLNAGGLDVDADNIYFGVNKPISLGNSLDSFIKKGDPRVKRIEKLPYDVTPRKGQ